MTADRGVEERMIREIDVKEITRQIRDMCIEVNYSLSEDMACAMKEAADKERGPLGKKVLQQLKENLEIAKEEQIPICQDTGMAVVFLDWGQDCHLTGGSLEEAVNDGVRRGYLDGRLRLSVVGDPLRRVNTNDNTPAILHLRMTAGDKVDITVAPKGFGSENMTKLKMFNPSASVEQVEDFIVDCMSQAGSNPCPPVVVGVGLGGTSEVAAELAKRALLRPVGERHPDPFYAAMEGRILERVNRLGIGPQGLGGRTTALSAAILTQGTHIAGLPCAVNLGCHVTRHAHVTL